MNLHQIVWMIKYGCEIYIKFLKNSLFYMFIIRSKIVID